ncbi:MAG: GTP-binding protein [Candidatus Heimdallarchaeota archaeon]|nr:GTP-binding protein [Candidatus Heimdallarchaeota archaeon]
MSDQEDNQPIYRYKTVLLGNAGVGKTSIKRTYFGMEFAENYMMTLGVDIAIKKYGSHAVSIYDVGGQPGFHLTFDTYIKETHAGLLVFDITNHDSLNNIFKWAEMLTIKSGKQLPMVLIGNKVDLRNTSLIEVSQEEAIEISRELTNNSIYEVPYIEVSARTGLNIDYAFDYLISTMDQVYEQQH